MFQLQLTHPVLTFTRYVYTN